MYKYGIFEIKENGALFLVETLEIQNTTPILAEMEVKYDFGKYPREGRELILMQFFS